MTPLKKLNRLERLALLLCAGLIALSLGLWGYQQLSSDAARSPAQLGGDFTLEHVDGPVALTDFRGQVVTLMFGYTSCPDVCPGGLANLAAAISRLTVDEQQQLQPLFISVDPERDELSKLDQYSRYFYPRLLGISASSQRIDAVVRRYGAFYRKVAMPESALGYSVDHSSRIYLINRQGQLVTAIAHNTAVNSLAQALRNLISQTQD